MRRSALAVWIFILLMACALHLYVIIDVATSF